MQPHFTPFFTGEIPVLKSAIFTRVRLLQKDSFALQILHKQIFSIFPLRLTGVPINGAPVFCRFQIYFTNAAKIENGEHAVTISIV